MNPKGGGGKPASRDYFVCQNLKNVMSKSGHELDCPKKYEGIRMTSILRLTHSHKNDNSSFFWSSLNVVLLFAEPSEEYQLLRA